MKNLEETRKNLISTRHNNDENKRQNIRKQISPSSRFLDNYFNTNIHQKNFLPNGLFQIKKKYEYDRVGLTHYYEKNNVPQKLDNKIKTEKIKRSSKNFLEFEYMENNDIIVTIEHCSNCQDHQTHTHHINDIYLTFAKIIQKCIILRFPFIKVFLKPIETEIIIQNANTMIIDNKYKDVRISAMEIQLGLKKKGKTEIIQLFSKLNSGMWPSVNNIVNNIAKHMPLFSINGKVYDREEGLDKEKAELYSPFENIKVNLYQLASEQIKELTLLADDELSAVLNPKKRNEAIRRGRTEEANGGIHISGSLTRPITSRSKMTERLSSAITYSARPLSTNSKFRLSRISARDNEILEDKDKTHGMKGLMLRSTFTIISGEFSLKDLPYDSYLLEVEDSKNFLMTSVIIKNNHYVENLNIQKILGLRRQINSYVEVYVYFNLNSDDELNMQLVSGCDLVLRRCSENIADNNIFDDSLNKVQVKENKKINGRYEIITLPGRYILEVNKSGYELIRKDLELTTGENKINIELRKEKKFRIRVHVFNYTTSNPVSQTKLKITYSKNEESEEGLTDNMGEYVFETIKNDEYLTILAIKEGYILSQRTLIKEIKFNNELQDANTVEKTWETEHITKDVYIYIVKEGSVEADSALVLAYSNSFADNYSFEFCNNAPYSIKVIDKQFEYGILACHLKRIEQEYEEELSEIIRLVLHINNTELKKNYDMTHHLTINGLQRFSCEVCIYTATNMFFISAPQYSREEFNFWDLGCFDIKNMLLYELGLLTKSLYSEKDLYFREWVIFLQIIIDNKLYSKLFESFNFNKGILSLNDRLLYEPAFIRSVKNIANDCLSVDFMIFLCDLMKNNFQMVSFSIFKKKIASNLKNFSQINY